MKRPVPPSQPDEPRAQDAAMDARGNLLVHDDAATWLASLAESARGTVDLAYLDPPFNVGAAFTARMGPSQRRARGQRGAGPVAYHDAWGGLDGFLSFLEGVLSGLRELLSADGTVWLHLDYRSVHEAKGVADRVFGGGTFRSEVIWVPGNGARGRAGPSITHQTLLVYAARPKARIVWNSDHPDLREPYADTSLSMHFRSVDAQGRRYRERVIAGRTYRYYADEGRRLGSVWNDIPAMAANTPIHSEGTGYPTQKPELLLERIVRLSSLEGATVCDPTCGSGTTLAVAARLGRRFLGCDSSPLAIEVASRRLRDAGVPFDLVQ